MRFFITGGSGYLGRNFIQYAMLEDPNLHVVALSRSSVADERLTAAANAVPTGKDRLRIVRGDIEDENALKEGMRDADVVVHMAAKVQPSGYWEDFQRITVDGTKRVVDLIHAMPEKKPRLVHISSFTAHLRYRHKDKLPDWAPYSKSKCLSEDVVVNGPLTDSAALRLGWLWGHDDDLLINELYTFIHTNPLWKVAPRVRPISVQYIINACESVYVACVAPVLKSRVYEFKDPEGELGMEDFVRLYVGNAFDLEKVPLPFDHFRFPKCITWAGLVVLENIPFLGYSKEWVLPAMSREPISMLFYNYRMDDRPAREELGYVGKVSREKALQDLREYRRRLREEGSAP